MSIGFTWMIVTGSVTAAAPEGGHRRNDLEKILDFEDPVSANSHKITRYTDFTGTDVAGVCMDALLVFRFLDG
jgi:hypothetical protein